MNERIDLQPIRCSHCGRFLGFVFMPDGLLLLKCKNCTDWSILAEGPSGEGLTTKELRAIILAGKGNKAD